MNRVSLEKMAVVDVEATEVWFSVNDLPMVYLFVL